jgi:hypothetical protein
MSVKLKYASIKRQSRKVHHERVEVANDYEVVYARTSGSRSSRNKNDRVGLRSPQRGRTSWTVADGCTWYPADDRDLALDPDSLLYDGELQKEIFASQVFVNQNPKKRSKARSRRSVSIIVISHYFVSVCPASPSHYLEGNVSFYISR